MKVKHLTLASAGSLLMVGAAQAAFLGVEIKSFDHWFGSDINVGGGNVQAAWNGGPARDAYRIYAVFDSATEILGTFGDPTRPMYVHNVDNGTFFNYTETTKGVTTHFDNMQTSGFTPNPSKAFDTFATVGGVTAGSDSTQFSPPGSGGDNGGVGNHFQVNWSSNEGVGGTYAWFVTGSPAQAMATQNPQGLFGGTSPHGAATDGRYYVLLYQAVVAEGKKVEGNIGVALVGQNINDERNFFSTNPVPGPGALALLGLAGLAGTRRRRSN